MALSAVAKRGYVEARRRYTKPDSTPLFKKTSELQIYTDVWLMAMELAEVNRISPWDALLLAVRRRAARVQWVDNIISELIRQHIANAGDPAVPPDTIKPWLKESRMEEQLMVRSAKLAIDAGVAEAVVRRLELEGKVTTDAMIAGLDSLDLSPEDRLKALTVMHGQLSKNDNNDGNIIES